MYLLSNYWIDCINNGEIKEEEEEETTGNTQRQNWKGVLFQLQKTKCIFRCSSPRPD
jgi:hypothetical protein